MKIAAGLIIFLGVGMRAAEAPGPHQWRAAEFSALAKTLAGKMDETKSGMQPLVQGPGFNAIVFHREGTGQAEIHEKLADFLTVRSGRGAVVVGGKAIDAKPTGPGELRGARIEGGTRYVVAAGDVLYMPANTAHQVVVEPGTHMDAVVIKVEAR